MDTLRVGIVGMGVQGNLYAAILSGAVPGLEKPARCRLTAVSSRSPETWEKEEFTAAQQPGMPYVEIFENFSAHILAGEPLIADGEAGLRQVQLANAIQLSGWKNAPVSVPCDEAEFDRELQIRIDSEG